MSSRGARPATARALRLTGLVDDDRLSAAVDTVVGTFGVLAAPLPGAGGDHGPVVRRSSANGSPAARDQQCVDTLRRDKDSASAGEMPARFHLIRCEGNQVVLGLVADPTALDLRSIYLVLGAVMQVYLGRFRSEQYPPFEGIDRHRPAISDRALQGRRTWWTRRCARWEHPAEPTRDAGDRPRTGRLRSLDLRLTAERWSALTRAAGGGDNAGALAVVSLLTLWLRSAEPGRSATVFSTELDLRDYAGLGPVIGPLTERIVFAVDTTGFDQLTFADLALRAHAGLLDSVVHYLPYDEIVGLAAARQLLDPRWPARTWDIDVHYCRSPPSSARTRGEETLADRGLSIELFQESALAGHGTPAPLGHGDGTAIQVQVAEAQDDLALVVTFDDALRSEAEITDMLAQLDDLAAQVVAAPGTRLPAR